LVQPRARELVDDLDLGGRRNEGLLDLEAIAYRDVVDVEPHEKPLGDVWILPRGSGKLGSPWTEQINLTRTRRSPRTSASSGGCWAIRSAPTRESSPSTWWKPSGGWLSRAGASKTSPPAGPSPRRSTP